MHTKVPFIKNHKMGESVKHQTVAGVIIYRKTDDGVKFLLLYRRGGYWNFPKGHFEVGERSLQTALREVEEETGIKPGELHLAPQFKTYVKFHFSHGENMIYDTVILYLAETKKFQVTVAPREHSGYAWFTYQDAMKILGRYVGTKRALTAAHNFLRNGARTGVARTHPHRQHEERKHFHAPRA